MFKDCKNAKKNLIKQANRRTQHSNTKFSESEMGFTVRIKIGVLKHLCSRLQFTVYTENVISIENVQKKKIKIFYINK